MPFPSNRKISYLALSLGSCCLFSCSDSKSDAKVSSESNTEISEYTLGPDDAGLAQKKISFNEHVRPIFNKNCTVCHGGVNVGNDSKMPGKLSLIYDITGVKGKSKNLAVIAGQAEASELFKRIIAPDGDEDLMPPAEHGPRLTENETQIIKQWIEEGAEWDVHWAYKTPILKVAPESDLKWGNSKIDTFIAAKLEDNHLHPAMTAKPATLLRRLSFDLTGLPPSIE